MPQHCEYSILADTPIAATPPAATEQEQPGHRLTLLVVEDDPLSRDLLLMRLAGLFKEVIPAQDGKHALALFHRTRPDLVLTDQMMPGMTGLELMREIRASGARTPVLLMTSIDERVLLEAINLGVERFVPKPFNLELLQRTLTGVAQEVRNRQLVEEHREQEVELLRYRDACNAMQQESGRRKERHVVRHDLAHQLLPGAGGVRWAIKVAYTPHDIMCGDGYSVRRLSDGRQLIFVVDAMGSGMSASLTAMLATSFLNYQVEHLHLWRSFTLPTLIERFQEYLGKVLLEEEMFSCGFFLVDLVREELQTAIFALPPLLLRAQDGSCRRLPAQNPPLTSAARPIRTGCVSLKYQADLLIMTDGVSDALIGEGRSYREVLEDDFRAAPTVRSLQRRFLKRVQQDEHDDRTLLHLLRLDLPGAWSWQAQAELTLAGLDRCTAEFLTALERQVELAPVLRDELEVVLTESLTNALEHGCLRIDRGQKELMIGRGDYETTLETLQPAPGSFIKVCASLWGAAQDPLLVLEVKDSGPGLPAGVFQSRAGSTSLNGRGLQMVSRFSDSLFYGGPGGHLIILKTLEKEPHHGD
jgi:CheY-like chemotaxis protein/anti-sigma regulatory factor (Ser/Thr protein kinase)